MKIIEKIRAKQANITRERQPVIAFLGDSVTHGCFDIFVKNGAVETDYQMQCGYREKVKAILQMLYPQTPIVTVNAGISGDRARTGKERLQQDVLSHQPDLVIVCYGLNDAMDGESGLQDYANALDWIFKTLNAAGTEIIWMTPNLRTDKLEVRFGEELLNECVENVIQNEKENWLQTYLAAAKKVAEENHVTICDCNRIWNTLKENDVNINGLLSNRVNHPTEQMHWVFAYELVKTMFEQ